MTLKNRIKIAPNALFLLFSSICFLMSSAIAQTLPYEIINSSEYSDDEIYVGLVGKLPPVIICYSSLSMFTNCPL